MPKDSTDTKLRLLDAAERLIGERGPEGVSMREISAAAEQANNNAAAYHFGSRDGIINAALDRRMADIERRRAEMVEALGPEPSMEELVRTLVVPIAEHGRHHPHFLAFHAQLRVSPAYTHLVSHERPHTSSYHVFAARLAPHLRHLTAEQAAERRWLLGVLIIHGIAEAAASPEIHPHDEWDEMVNGVVTACVTLLRSP